MSSSGLESEEMDRIAEQLFRRYSSPSSSGVKRGKGVALVCSEMTSVCWTMRLCIRPGFRPRLCCRCIPLIQDLLVLPATSDFLELEVVKGMRFIGGEKAGLSRIYEYTSGRRIYYG
ncbi:hypothetical protein SDJN02_01180, partial [Cucurbita argyrosperma subsp. argyrosperma]